MSLTLLSRRLLVSLHCNDILCPNSFYLFGLGPKAVDQYWPRPTEWPNAKRSDVLYAADNVNIFPPLLIQVQNIADDGFLHRVVQYCEEVNKQYDAIPLVLIFVVNKTRDNIIRKTTKDPRLPFLFKLPSFPWAKKCFILNNDSIRDHLIRTPLPPLVALGAFFIAQKPSLLNHDQRHDPTIQQLYSISKHVFENVATHEKTAVDDLLCLCDNSQSKFQEGIKMLENLADTSMKKRAIDCLNDGLEIIKSYKRKYMASQSPSPSPLQSPLPSRGPLSVPLLPSASSSSSLSVPSTSTPAQTLSSGNWKFVDDYIRSLGDEKMNWKACYLEGQRQGHFTNYTKPISLKNAYQRWKKQQTSNYEPKE